MTTTILMATQHALWSPLIYVHSGPAQVSRVCNGHMFLHCCQTGGAVGGQWCQ